MYIRHSLWNFHETTAKSFSGLAATLTRSPTALRFPTIEKTGCIAATSRLLSFPTPPTIDKRAMIEATSLVLSRRMHEEGRNSDEKQRRERSQRREQDVARSSDVKQRRERSQRREQDVARSSELENSSSKAGKLSN